MNNSESIYIVYAQKHYENSNSYFAHQLFSDEGHIEKELVIKSYEMEVDTWRLPKEEELVGPFQTLEKMQQFSFNLCQRMNFKKVVMLSVDSFNDAVEKSTNTTELVEKFAEYGDVIENLDQDSSKGFFGRIFH